MSGRCAILVAIVLVGCGCVRNTPEQKRLLSRVQECARDNMVTVTVREVSKDGKRFAIQGDDAGKSALVRRCLTERYGYRWQ
jgi:hypothetical protein